MKLRPFNGLQDPNELSWFCSLTQTLGVKSYLEIGSFSGDSLYAVIANAPIGSLGVTIDIDTRPSLGTREELSNLGYIIKDIQGDSKDPKVINQATTLGPYDLVLIDGDHTYDGISQDWSNYKDLAPVVAIHDVAGRDNPYTKDVYRFWQELKPGKKYIEVNFSDYQIGYGVIFNG